MARKVNARGRAKPTSGKTVKKAKTIKKTTSKSAKRTKPRPKIKAATTAVGKDRRRRRNARDAKPESKVELLSLGRRSIGKARAKPDRTRFDRWTLGALDLATRVEGLRAGAEPTALLRLPYRPGDLTGFDQTSIRVFRLASREGELRPIWNSGINTAFNFIWAKIQQPGVYVPIALPRDRILHEVLKHLAKQRALADIDTPKLATELTMQILEPLLNADGTGIERLRELVTQFEVGVRETPWTQLDMGPGGHPRAFLLPRGENWARLVKRLAGLKVRPEGLPEERLFNPPDRASEPPLPVDSDSIDLRRFDHKVFELERLIPKLRIPPFFFCDLLSRDWPMYQHDREHTGRASGYSSINSTTVGQLEERFTIPVDSPINSKPAIVGNFAYVGTSRFPKSSVNGGTLFKINICSGTIVGRFPTPVGGAFYGLAGVGGTPAVVGGRVYFTTVEGAVYCLDAASMTDSPPHPAPIWTTNLKIPDPVKKQPIDNPDGDCWSSPVVVNDRVYVGTGEGESSTCWGFVWCLDANTGEVVWLFSTNKQQAIDDPGCDNQPNKIPPSAAVSDPLPVWATAAGFSLMSSDPPETGSSPWSSLAYDATTGIVYVGTGNSEYTPPDGLASSVLPDQRYGSGFLALRASDGLFCGFHVGDESDSYWPTDADVDVPGSGTIFSRPGETRVLCYGSKNGAAFLLDTMTMQVAGGGAQRRQLLPRTSGTGHPGNRGNPIGGVAGADGTLKENKWGVMATPAIHPGLRMLYIGLGGYMGADDGSKTPFVRALDWDTLDDAWPTVTGVDGVVRYSLAQPPLYINNNEAALSSPATVNDVVFVSTTDRANATLRLYALDAATGLSLWASPEIPRVGSSYALGPAISGEYVAMGAGSNFYVYTRPGTPRCLIIYPFPWWRWEFERWPPLPIPPFGVPELPQREAGGAP